MASGINRLARNKQAKKLSPRKAKKILKHGEVKGRPLSRKQKRFFGAIAGGQRPYKK